MQDPATDAQAGPVPDRRPGTPPSMRDVLLAIRSGALEPPPAARLLNLRIIDVDDGLAVFGLTPRLEHLNGNGTVNGGLVATLADFAVCAAVNDVPITCTVATAGLNITYQRPITLETGEIHATGRLLHRTARTASVEARVTDLDGRLHAHAVGTVVLRNDSPDKTC